MLCYKKTSWTEKEKLCLKYFLFGYFEHFVSVLLSCGVYLQCDFHA